ncbi:hypothetical protein [Saccharopolyspora spinosa]|uniref:hypothetical protein n=1 Tax=Saccharopolyspora spinosa TaxID=60894 RepID=UPI000237A802|nr:hypothetical protein [Saccharopolyspora spinosa]
MSYVEVSSNSMTKVVKYTLASGGANVLDIGIVISAYINDGRIERVPFVVFRECGQRAR